MQHFGGTVRNLTQRRGDRSIAACQRGGFFQFLCQGAEVFGKTQHHVFFFLLVQNLAQSLQKFQADLAHRLYEDLIDLFLNRARALVRNLRSNRVFLFVQII